MKYEPNTRTASLAITGGKSAKVKTTTIEALAKLDLIEKLNRRYHPKRGKTAEMINKINEIDPIAAKLVAA